MTTRLPPLSDPVLEELVERALLEDLGAGDVTTEAIVGDEALGRGVIVSREPIVRAGQGLAAACFHRLDPKAVVESEGEDGDPAWAGETILTVRGKLRALLAAERTALNLLQRACGIATVTREYVTAVADTGVEILDTRKTAPGLRPLDKAAVRAGGGGNHRQGLFDMLLVKDNHVSAAGSLGEAVRRAVARAGHALKVEIEVDDLVQLDELLALERLPDVVLLDNFSPAQVREAVERIDGRLRVEVSGGISLETVRAHAEAGPDAISIGALTHSVRAADLSLELVGADG